jgi:hypothetical protein
VSNIAEASAVFAGGTTIPKPFITIADGSWLKSSRSLPKFHARRFVPPQCGPVPPDDEDDDAPEDEDPVGDDPAAPLLPEARPPLPEVDTTLSASQLWLHAAASAAFATPVATAASR